MDEATRSDLVALVEGVHQLPYGRPSDRTVASMLAEGRGTCSTKHAYLHDRLTGAFPETRPRVVHRVYVVTEDLARLRFGDRAAQAVPAEGLVDVHRYLVLALDGADVVVDATFPGPAWNGTDSMPLACGPGTDHPSTGDPADDKARLEELHCRPEVREPFIAALSS